MRHEQIAAAFNALERLDELVDEAIEQTPVMIRGAIGEPLRALVAWANAITELATNDNDHTEG